MKKFAILMTVLLTSGCATLDEAYYSIDQYAMNAAERRCQHYGFQPGTVEMAQCKMQTRQHWKNNMERDFDRMQWQNDLAQAQLSWQLDQMFK